MHIKTNGILSKFIIQLITNNGGKTKRKGEGLFYFPPPPNTFNMKVDSLVFAPQGNLKVLRKMGAMSNSF